MSSKQAIIVTALVALAFAGGIRLALYIVDAPPIPDPPIRKSSAKPTPPSEPPSPGRWKVYRNSTADNGVPDVHAERIEEIRSLGYVSGSREAPDRSGITIHDEANAYAGLNLYSSGHAAVAMLVDMNGNLIHSWKKTFAEIWPNWEPSGGRKAHQLFWRRVHLYPNGDLLAIFDGLGLIKLDKDSNVIWAKPCGAHHDLEVTGNGDIHVLIRETKPLERINRNQEVLEDFILTLDKAGSEVSRISLLEAFENSRFHNLLLRMPTFGDLFHTNTIERLDGRLAHRSDVFADGNFLISVWALDTIAIVDPKKKEVVWTMNGQWRRQHQPTILPNGNLMIFDNLADDENSQVLELDPLSQAILWDFRGDASKPFFSYTCGSSQRLKNGNTLITESDNGRAFEVTHQKKIVWEFVNPSRAGDHGELIATLFEMIRLEPDFPTGWADNPA